MKRLIFLLLFVFSMAASYAQLNDNCVNAIPLCSNPSFTFFTNSGPGSIVDFSVPALSNISNPGTNPNPPNSGCLLSGELNPQWLLITVGNTGTLEFVFGAGNSQNPQVGLYDWSMWPYSPTACANIFNNTLPPIRCNWNGSSTGGTGIASASTFATFNGNASNFEPPLAVTACQQFIICISNYSGVNTLVSFQNLGTASLSCNPNCNPNYVTCAGSPVSIVPVNFSALTNPTYSLQPGNLSNNTGTFVVSPLVTTAYTTYITGLNANNVVQTTTAVSNVTVNPQPFAAPTVTQSTCTNPNSAFNLGVTFTPSAPAPGYTVTYSPSIPGLGSSQSSYSGVITPNVYNAVITAAGGCQATASFVINPQPTIPVFTVSPASPVYTVTCASPTVYVSATDPFLNYSWDNNQAAIQTGSIGAFTNLSIGNTWTLTGTDPVTGCTNTLSFQVVLNTTPPTSTITPVSQLISCTNTAVQTVTGNATPNSNIIHEFFWSYGGSASSNATTAIAVPGAGTHTYVVTNLINGCKVTKTFTVATSSGVPTFNLASPVQNFSIGCAPKDVADLIIQNGNTNPSGGTVDYTVTTAAFTGTPSFTGANTFTFNTPGNYIAYIRDVVSGCVTKTQFSIIQNTVEPPQQVAIPTQTLTCFTPTILMVGSSPISAPGYQWIYSGGSGTLVSPGPNFTTGVTANETSTTVASYTFQVTDPNNACFSRSVIPIYQNIITPQAKITGPNASAAAAITCGTPAVILQNASLTRVSSPPFPTPGQLIIAREWKGPSPQPDLQNSSTYTAEIPGTYSMLVQDMNNGCYSSTVFTVGDNRDYPVANNPVAAPFATLDCNPNPLAAATVSAYITSTVNLIYQWYNLSGGAYPIKNYQGSAGTPTGVATENVSLPGEYRVVITNTANGCSVISLGKVLIGSLTAAFMPDKTEGFAPLSVTFENNSISVNTNSISSVWNFGNGNTQTVSANNYSLPVTQLYNQPGSYTVTLYSSKGQCFDSTFQVITVEIPSKLEIPNVFTPNGDGANDLFFVRMANLNEIKASIYDRWGNLVYEETNSKGNIEWDGTNLYGKECSEGTYYYVITATGKDNKSYDKKGSISLYR